MKKIRNPIVLPAGGASQASVNKATDEIKEVVYKSVAGLEVELNKTASATANGTLVVEPSDGKDVMEKATVTVAIPLEDNKAATIDVSQYASAVEVTPTDGKTAMKKTTVTLSNIPQIEANKEASITQNGTVEVTPTSGKDAMAKTTVTVNVSGGGADLEDNKEATIDVSAYTDPVEVTPTAGKDGMKKVTVSLSNMPAGANMLYAWTSSSVGLVFFNFDNAPQNASAFYETFMLGANIREEDLQSLFISHPSTVEVFTRTSDTEFTVVPSGGTSVTFTRDSTKDVEVWNAPPEVETTKQATIDVSAYDPANKPVITPTAGKQSMGSVEVTLSNIPSGGVTKLYYVEDLNGDYDYWVTKDPQTITVGESVLVLKNPSTTTEYSYETVTVTNIIETEEYTEFDCDGLEHGDFCRRASYSQYDVELV